MNTSTRDALFSGGNNIFFYTSIFLSHLINIPQEVFFSNTLYFCTDVHVQILRSVDAARLPLTHLTLKRIIVKVVLPPSVIKKYRWEFVPAVSSRCFSFFYNWRMMMHTTLWPAIAVITLGPS